MRRQGGAVCLLLVSHSLVQGQVKLRHLVFQLHVLFLQALHLVEILAMMAAVVAVERVVCVWITAGR